LKNFINHRSNTNITALAATHRHDLQESSCINKEVQVFDRKLHKIFKARDNAKMLDINLNRNNFTQQGLHLNTVGKEKVAKIIAKNIRQFRVKKKISPYLLTKKEIQKMYGLNAMKPSPKQRSTWILRAILRSMTVIAQHECREDQRELQ
jgi:hypothetical protein